MRAEPTQPLGSAQPDEGAIFCMAGGAAPQPSHKLIQRLASGAEAQDEALELPTMQPVPLLQHDLDAERCCGVCLHPPSALPLCPRHSLSFFRPNNSCMCLITGQILNAVSSTPTKLTATTCAAVQNKSFQEYASVRMDASGDRAGSPSCGASRAQARVICSAWGSGGGRIGGSSFGSVTCASSAYHLRLPTAHAAPLPGGSCARWALHGDQAHARGLPCIGGHPLYLVTCAIP